jgi:hypothetical protein
LAGRERVIQRQGQRLGLSRIVGERGSWRREEVAAPRDDISGGSISEYRP